MTREDLKNKVMEEIVKTKKNNKVTSKVVSRPEEEYGEDTKISFPTAQRNAI